MQSKRVRFLAFVGVIVLFIVLGRIFQVDIDYLRTKVVTDSLILSSFIFIGLYVGLTTFIWFGPKDVLRIVAGVVFGANISTVLVTIGELFNSIIFFHISRNLGQEYAQEKFGIKTDQIEKVKKSAGFWGALALRINMIFPMRLLDLSYGLTRIDFLKYFTAVVLATPFRVYLLQYVIAQVGEKIITDPQEVMSFMLNDVYILKYSFMYVGIIIIFSIIALVIKLTRKDKVNG